jgi:integrase/recombinase XerD
MRRILSAIDPTSRVALRDRAILEVLYATGLRRMELLALATADVDLEAGLVRVSRGKGGRGRVVPLGREAAAWVGRYLVGERPKLVGGAATAALWVSMQGRALSVPGLLKLVREAVARAGLSAKITPHAFRRACATEMVRAGAPLWPVKELLGHARLETLRRYARLTSNDVREAHRKYHPRERT